MNNYNRYNSSYGFKYKSGYISGYSVFDGHWPVGKYVEIIKVRVDQWAYLIEVKSMHAAKIMITKHEKKYGGGK